MSADESITSLSEAVAARGALPVPVLPEPRTLDVVEHELTGARLSLYEEELETARLRLALKSAQRGRRELRDDYEFAEGSRQRWRTACIDAERELDELRARVAELEAALLVANRALEDVARARRDCPCAGDRPHQVGCPQDGVPVAASSFAERAARESDPARRAAWRMLAEPEPEFHAYLHHENRVGHDLPETGAKGVEPDEERLLDGDELRRAVRGHLFGGGS